MQFRTLMDMGNWAPYNRDMVAAYGADAAIFFSELCRLAEQFKASESEFWFYASAETLIEKTGFTERKVESAIATLCKADLIMIDKRPPFNRRHFRIVQNAADFKAAISIDVQTPDRAQKTPPRAKETPNTAKECEPTPEPIGNTEQLVKEQKPKKPKTDPAEIEAAAVRLIEHLNAVAGTAFRTSGKVNIEKFARVLKAKEGTEEEIRMVIELKTMQWSGKEEMKSHLNPETLTRPRNFPRYLEECYNAKAQQNTPRPAAAGFAARDNTLTIELPNGQIFGTGYSRADQDKIRMVISHLHEYPGIQKHLPPRLASPDYLSAISENDLRFELKQARNKWRPPNFYSNNEPPF